MQGHVSAGGGGHVGLQEPVVVVVRVCVCVCMGVACELSAGFLGFTHR